MNTSFTAQSYTDGLIVKELAVRLWICVGLVWGLSASAANATCAPLLDYSYRPLTERSEQVRLCERFDDQVILVVNTASKCGYTPQYEGLELLNARYAERGFAVAGFPSNDFGGQEPGTEAEIREFCTLTYGVKFPMFEKTTVVGDDADPFYQALTALGGPPKWNFHKYLIARDGSFIAAFPSSVKPEDPKLVEAIEQALAN